MNKEEKHDDRIRPVIYLLSNSSSNPQTYCIDRDGTDSASSATAYLTGVKARYSTIGVGGKVFLSNCASTDNGDHDVDSVLVDAFRQGRNLKCVFKLRERFTYVLRVKKRPKI